MTPPIALVIEDDPNLLPTIVRMFRRLGYAVLTAGDLVQGENLLEAHQDSVVIVVCDTNLPGGFGPDLHAAKQALLSRNRIGWLGLTAEPLKNVKAKAYYEAEGIELIEKPFGVDEFTNAVRRAVKK
jgi:DNA-binding response OmpR family regulator